MDRLRGPLLMERVRIPAAGARVYKQECALSFDDAESPGGLFVDLASHVAFGRRYVEANLAKTGNPVYLRITRTLKEKKDDAGDDARASDGQPLQKKPAPSPTVLGVGVDGGFGGGTGPGEDDYEESYAVVVLPEFEEVPFPNAALPERVIEAANGVLAAAGAERTAAVDAFVADEERKVSKYAESLEQLDNGVKISPDPTTWKCEESGMTENLWLNLSTGHIGSGRRNWDGSGGTGAALTHYEATGSKYPLAVKLGTITPEGADVFSYAPDENDLVEDPHLAKHLAHWGIDVMQMTKTDKSMAELELDMNVAFDFSKLTEEGKVLEPLYGPGYTGMKNLGNSCYMASVIQAMFATEAFATRYGSAEALRAAFEAAPSDPSADFALQMCKLGHGLLSGDYSKPPAEGTAGAEGGDGPGGNGVSPRAFKNFAGAGHAEFSTGRQQDAFEFYQWLLQLVERGEHARASSSGAQATTATDPSLASSFKVEERTQCEASGKVRYVSREENALSVPVPLEAAVNKAEVAAFEEHKAAVEAAGQKVDAATVVRPKVPLTACLAAMVGQERVDGFMSTATGKRGVALKSMSMLSYPDTLVIHVKKFVVGDNWVPTKLDVELDVPEELDLGTLGVRSPGDGGVRPGEEALPEEGSADAVAFEAAPAAAAAPQADPSIVAQLASMGFPEIRCQKAALATQNSNADMAMNWLLEHMDDPDIDAPIVPAAPAGAGGGGKPEPPAESVEMLVAMGFDAPLARRALEQCDNNIERAADALFNGAVSMDIDGGADAAASSAPARALTDGAGKYRLRAMCSHMGSSVHAGHYVAHRREPDGSYTLLNDNKVMKSQSPPLGLGYVYVYTRA